MSGHESADAVRAVLNDIRQELWPVLFHIDRVQPMISVWEVTAALGDKTGAYTFADKQDLHVGTFLTDGTPKHWRTRPATGRRD